jgi:hypothetical protein
MPKTLVLTMTYYAAASGSSTLPSPAESHRSQQEQSLLRPEGGINLDYMPDELLTGDLV